MTVMVMGAGGFVGGYIAGFLRNNGHRIFTLSRASSSKPNSHGFPVGFNGEFDTEKLLDFFLRKKIKHVVHCSNKFAATPNFSVANEMLLVNYLLPARVLRVAIEASAQSFINLASASQVTQGRLEGAQDYLSSKESFREYLELNLSRIRARTLFVNGIFGATDPREKLINLAFQSALSKELLKVRSERSELGFVYLPRLASEISGLISGTVERPESYLYENYSRIPVKALMTEIGNLLGAGKFWVNLDLDPEFDEVTSLPKFGQCDRESLVKDLAQLVPSGYYPALKRT